MSLSQSAFIVTTSIRGVKRTQVWEGTSPLSVGHPLQWVIEKTPDGVRARRLGLHFNQTQSGTTLEISAKEILKGTEIQLPNQENLKNPCIIKIRPVQKTSAPYQGQTGDTLTVFSCMGNTIISSTAPKKEFQGVISHKPAFTLRIQGQSVTLQAHQEGLALLKEGSQEIPLSKDLLKLSATELASSSIVTSVNKQRWHFGILQSPPAAAVKDTNTRAMDSETRWFFHSLKYATLAFAAFIALSWIWPKPKPTEDLIPPQIAKLVLAKPAAAKLANEDAGGGKPSTAQKIEKAAVVQAFRAKALQNSISGLLKGGMTRLMSQSSFMMGTAGSAEARKMFDTKSAALQATAPDTGLMNAKTVAVSAIGGGGGGGAGGGTGVGYGSGQKAGIQGQGSSMVSLDLGNTEVAEGLSKDEVGEVIHKHLAEVRYCYESAILRSPGIEGRLVVNFTINKTGAVSQSEVKTSTLPDPRLDDCIIRRLVTWKFPQPKGGVDVGVSYPFIFKTLGR